MQGPVSPDSLSASSWVRMSSICSRWDGMFVSVTGALSSNERRRRNLGNHVILEKIRKTTKFRFLEAVKNKIMQFVSFNPSVRKRSGTCGRV